MKDKIKREGIRWNIINTLNKARPYPTSEVFLLDVILAIYGECSKLELRKHLDYLEDRKLVEVEKTPHGLWLVTLTRIGIDLAEYTVDCEAGIARPPKYWSE